MLLAQLSAGFQSLPPYPTSKLGPSVADSWLGGFAYVLGPCGSLQLSCETGSFSCHCNPHKFLQPEVLKLYLPALEPWVVCSVSLPSCSSWLILLHQLSPGHSPPPPFWSSSHPLVPNPLHPIAGLDECFFFNSLVVRLPYSSIFWQFWLFFVFKFVFVFLSVM